MSSVPLAHPQHGHDQAHEIVAARAGRVAAALAGRVDAVVGLWEDLGAEGPTAADPRAGEPAQARACYLRPLAELLGDALGSQESRAAGDARAVYLDERQRYLPKNLTGAEQATLLSDRLGKEEQALAELLAAQVEKTDVLAALSELHRPLTSPPAPDDDVRVLFVGDCLFNDVRTFLAERTWRDDGRRLDTDHLYVSAGNRPLEPDDIARATSSVPPALVGLSLFTYSGVPLYGALLADARKLRGSALAERVDLLVDLLRASIDAVREVSDATILVHGVCGLPVGPRRLRTRVVPVQWPSRTRVVRALTARIGELVDATENTILVDEDALIRSAGGLRQVGARILDDRFAAAYTHPSRFGPVLAEEYADVLASYRVVGRAKALLVDFDNTLWSGVMGEGKVVHDVAAQRLLKRLREAGVLLVALSKNDPAAIRWDEMELDRDDFVLHRIDWNPKPDNVLDVVSQLDLAPEAFVLLDDNPVERALVLENVPGVQALDPGDPFAWRTLERWLEFPSTQRTDEARRRTEMYREAAERRQAMNPGLDYEGMMRSLSLRGEVRRAGPEHVERIAELMARTNQFNTTTRRRTAAEVRALIDSDDHDVWFATLGDRFGDLGIVAAAVVRRPDSHAAELDAVIMSCRAMGFGLETLLLHEVMNADADRVWHGLFVPSDRNGPAAALFPANGFAEVEPGRFRSEPGALPPRPVWF